MNYKLYEYSKNTFYPPQRIKSNNPDSNQEASPIKLTVGTRQYDINTTMIYDKRLIINCKVCKKIEKCDNDVGAPLRLPSAT